MGEAKRRKAAGQGYGAPRLEVEVSKITGKQLIVLRSRSRELVISPHASTESLNFGLGQCRRCLESISSEMWQRCPDDAFDLFMQRIITPEFIYPDDDEIVGVLDLDRGAVDVGFTARNEVTAESNISSIHSAGKRLWTHPLTDWAEEANS